jgi:hypothetical protein
MFAAGQEIQPPQTLLCEQLPRFGQLEQAQFHPMEGRLVDSLLIH